MSAPNLRTCIGSKRFGIEPHQASPTDFPAQPSQRDGLGRMCKIHWNAYTRGLARDARARAVPVLDAADSELGYQGDAAGPSVAKAAPTRRGKFQDGLDAQLVEHAELERRLDAVGGAGTDEGQAILESAAAKAVELRNRKGASTKAKMPTEDVL
jgi:hypothetical protein